MNLHFKIWLYSELVSMGGVGMPSTNPMDMEDFMRMKQGAFPSGVSATPPAPKPLLSNPLSQTTTIRRKNMFSGKSIAGLMSKPITVRPQ